MNDIDVKFFKSFKNNPEIIIRVSSESLCMINNDYDNLCFNVNALNDIYIALSRTKSNDLCIILDDIKYVFNINYVLCDDLKDDFIKFIYLFLLHLIKNNIIYDNFSGLNILLYSKCKDISDKFSILFYRTIVFVSAICKIYKINMNYNLLSLICDLHFKISNIDNKLRHLYKYFFCIFANTIFLNNNLLMFSDNKNNVRNVFLSKKILCDEKYSIIKIDTILNNIFINYDNLLFNKLMNIDYDINYIFDCDYSIINDDIAIKNIFDLFFKSNIICDLFMNKDNSTELKYLNEISKIIPGYYGSSIILSNFNILSSIYFVDVKKLQYFIDRITTAFKIQFNYLPYVRICNISKGIDLL